MIAFATSGGTEIHLGPWTKSSFLKAIEHSHSHKQKDKGYLLKSRND